MIKKTLLTTLLILGCLLGAGELRAQTSLIPLYGFETDEFGSAEQTTKWLKINTNSNSVIGTTQHHIGNSSFTFSGGGSSGPNPQTIISPIFVLSSNITVSLYYKCANTSNQQIRIGVSTSDNRDLSDNSWTWSEYQIISSTSWTELSYSPSTSGVQCIAIQYDRNNATYPTGYIDDISVTVTTAASCATPTGLSAAATTSTTANVSWTAGGDEEEWTLEYSTDEDFSVPANITTIEDIMTTSQELTGLDENTTYYVRVKAVCGASDESDWTNPESFKTLSKVSIPYSYNFNDGGSDLDNWTIRDNETNTGWYSSMGYNNSACFKFNGKLNVVCNQLLIAPELNSSSTGVFVSFKYNYTVEGAKKLFIGYSTTNINSFEWVDEISVTTNSFLTYEGNYPAGTKYIAIKCRTESTGQVYVDDFSVKATPIASSDGDWNSAATWEGEIPSTKANVIISSDVTIPANYTAQANNITIDGGSLTIADGGQLITNNAVQATLQKSIEGWNVTQTQGSYYTDGWYFIASPVNNYATENIIITDYSNTDLFSYDEEHNYWFHADGSANPFPTLTRGQGYLYANSTGDDLSFIGEVPATNSNIEIDLSFVGSGKTKGCNLLGNPFTCNLTTSNVKLFNGTTNTVISSYYTVENGTELSQMTLIGNPIKPGRGFLIQASAANQKLVFNPDSKSEEATAKPSFITIEAGNDQFMDRACIQFGNGNTLRKMSINDQVSHVYVINDGKDYAAATITEMQGQIPVNFVVAKNGQYTIKVKTDNLETSYLHLIDNLTGANVDLLQTPSYTFQGRTSDIAARFRLLFTTTGVDENDDQNENHKEFAFVSDGQLIVNGTGTLYVYDALGRQVSVEQLSTVNCLSTANYPTGLYLLQLVDGNSVRTQKIIMK